MFDRVPAQLLRLAAELDADALSPSEAVRALDDLGAARRVLDGMIARVAKRVEDTGTASVVGERSAAALVARKLGVGVSEARTTIDTARQLAALPKTDDAVRRGRLSLKQAALIAGAAAENPAAETELLRAADRGLVNLRDACVTVRARGEDPGERRERHRRRRHLRLWTDTDGMLAGAFALPPEIGGRFKARLDAEMQRRFRARRGTNDYESPDAYAADALAAFVLGDDDAPARGVKATVHVVIDHSALVRGEAVEGETCEIPGVGPVDVQWARQLLGSSFLTAIVKKGKDLLTVAHLGRHVPAEIQTALLVGGRECCIEGCGLRGYLERDHTHDYAKGGPTAYWNPSFR
jgi:hypothetical protein